MSGVRLGHQGRTLETGGLDDGWKWIRSATHITLYWTSLTGDRYAGGILHPTITLRTGGWWRYLLVGVVKPHRGLTLVLGPLLVEWEPVSRRLA